MILSWNIYSLRRALLIYVFSLLIRQRESALQIIPESKWRASAERHCDRVKRLAGGSLESLDPGNPITNFLFKYYFWKPAAVAQYSAGAGKVLLGASFEEMPKSGSQRRALPYYDPNSAAEGATGHYFDASTCSLKTLLSFQAILELLETVQERPPSYSCYGLHEWAMLYVDEDKKNATKEEQARHQSLPLRLSQEALNTVVRAESHDTSHRTCSPTSPAVHPTIRCTHYDAFRFFTPDAVPLNFLPPSALGRGGPGRATAQLNHEQPGCVHATMDLFKYAMKLHPWCSSELVADCLELARDARLLDMRASPYDLQHLTEKQRRCYGESSEEGSHTYFDVSPIKIESSQGRGQYAQLQESMYRRALPLRRRLIHEYSLFLEDAKTGALADNR